MKGPDPWVSGCRAEIGKIRNVLIFTESFCSGIPMATMDTLGQVSYKKVISQEEKESIIKISFVWLCCPVRAGHLWTG